MRIDTNYMEHLADGTLTGETVDNIKKVLARSAAELRRLYAHENATTPFKDRAALEEYLKGKGFVPNSRYINQFNHPNHTGWVDIEVDCDRPMFYFSSIIIPLSALTPAILNSMLETK